MNQPSWKKKQWAYEKRIDNAKNNLVPKEECLPRGVYEIYSRNLVVGVYRPETGGFIGIREKYGSFYLFEEYHWENGPPYGTVKPFRLITMLPEDIEVKTNMGTLCDKCNKPTEWKADIDKETGAVLSMGKWYYKDTDEEICGSPVGVSNKKLLDFLKEIEEKEIKDNDNPWIDYDFISEK